MKTTTAAFAASMLFTATAGRAQSALFFGGHLTGVSLTSLSTRSLTEAVPFGSGYGMHAGLSIDRSFGLLVLVDQTIHGLDTDTTDRGQWDFLGRMSWKELGPATAYLTAGLSRVRASTASRGDSPCGELKPTAGLTGELSLTSRLALDAGVLWTVGNFKVSEDHYASLVQRAYFGVSYSLFSGR